MKKAFPLLLAGVLLLTNAGSAFAQLPPIVPADTTPPVISGVGTSALTSIAATIIWTTDEAAVSTFEYGTTQSYGSTTSLPSGALLAHTAVLTSLQPSTTYYYCIHATDLAGNTANFCGHSFTTQAAADTTPPVVSAIAVASISTSGATITWATSENATTHVDYGTSASYGSTVVPDNSLALTHSVSLTGLSANTTYHYRVVSADAAGNTSTTSDQTFTTVAVSVSVSDTTPPVISGVANDSVLATAITLVWQTNELAISTLEYGTTSSYGSAATIPATALLAHTVILTGLQSNTTYYYCIHATDLFTNTANSCGHSVTTGAAPIVPDTTAPVISGVTEASLLETEATIAWSTDELATGAIRYGLTTNYGSQATVSGGARLDHAVVLTGLTAGTILLLH